MFLIIHSYSEKKLKKNVRKYRTSLKYMIQYNICLIILIHNARYRTTILRMRDSGTGLYAQADYVFY